MMNSVARPRKRHEILNRAVGVALPAAGSAAVAMTASAARAPSNMRLPITVTSLGLQSTLILAALATAVHVELGCDQGRELRGDAILAVMPACPLARISGVARLAF